MIDEPYAAPKTVGASPTRGLPAPWVASVAACVSCAGVSAWPISTGPEAYDLAVVVFWTGILAFVVGPWGEFVLSRSTESGWIGAMARVAWIPVWGLRVSIAMASIPLAILVAPLGISIHVGMTVSILVCLRALVEKTGGSLGLLLYSLFGLSALSLWLAKFLSSGLP